MIPKNNPQIPDVATMERLMDTQFFLLINGPSCGGKSSVSDILFKKYGGIFNGKSDVIKWLISDYQSDAHRKTVHRMTIETLRVALSHGLSAIKEGGLWEPQAYVELSESAGVPLFIANVEAPWEVLASRFETRVKAKRQGARISNANPRRFRELYDMYHATKMRTGMEFDSSKESPEQIADRIVAFMREHSVSTDAR